VRYLHEGAAADDIVGEDEVPQGRDDEGAEEAVHAKLPRLLTLAGAGIDAGHQEDDVEGRKRVEDLRLVSCVQTPACASCPTLRVKFHVCSASLVALEVKMSR
jgi:hypothetical protein